MTSSKDPRLRLCSPRPALLHGFGWDREGFKGLNKEYLRVVPHILKLLSWTWLRPWVVDYIWTIMHIHDFDESDSCHAKIMHSFWNAPSRCQLELRPRPHWRAYNASTGWDQKSGTQWRNPGGHRGPWPPSSGWQNFFTLSWQYDWQYDDQNSTKKLELVLQQLNRFGLWRTLSSRSHIKFQSSTKLLCPRFNH